MYNGDASSRQDLSKIEQTCLSFQDHAQCPIRVKSATRKNKEFNDTIFVKFFIVKMRSVQSIVDETTRFCTAGKLGKVSSDEIWLALRLCWISTSPNLPLLTTHNASNYYIENSLLSPDDMLHIRTKTAPVESASMTTAAEFYHWPCRLVFSVIYTEPSNAVVVFASQMAIKATNNFVGLYALFRALLDYGVLLRPTLHSTRQRRRHFPVSKHFEEQHHKHQSTLLSAKYVTPPSHKTVSTF